MEVHAHAHTARKKWTHYLWEFIMLFLAVFCGFLAEYFLEHKIEKEKGKEYAQSFREDLCKDTAIIRENIGNLKKIITAGDSITSMLLNDRTHSKDDIKKLYDYNLASLSGFSVILTDRTSIQLKNAGGMRLITNKKVAEGVVKYWIGMEALTRIEASIQDMKWAAREKSYAIFNTKYYSDSSINGKRIISDDAALMIKDPLVLIELANRITHVKNLMKGAFINTLKKQQEEADQLIQVIDKEYHFK